MGMQAEDSKMNRKNTYAVWFLLCLVCLAVMLTFVAVRESRRAKNNSEQRDPAGDISQTNLENQEGLGTQNNSATQNNSDFQMKIGEQRVQVKNTSETPGLIYLSLPLDVSAEQMTLENRYLEKELLITIENANVSMDFFAQNAICGDTSQVRVASVCEQDGRIILTISLKSILEFKSTIQDNTLLIACVNPHDLYDYIVILDPSCGEGVTSADGSTVTEEEITLEIAKQVVNKSELDNVRIYLTRLGNNGKITDSAGLELLEEVEPDFYIRLSASLVTDPGSYGIAGYYNKDYYIPRLQNVMLADMLTKSVTIAASNRAVGVKSVDEKHYLYELKLPAAELSVGYLSNEQERKLLIQKEYRDKIADGILNAIVTAVLQLEADET